MLPDFFKEVKKNLEKEIPEADSLAFRKLRDSIRKQLQKKETDFLMLLRSLKILVLGDWHNEEKKEILFKAKNGLLENGIYAETIDNYYDLNKKTGLSQMQILETACINHQLIVFIDGDGKGTITEQNYLSENYVLHGKTIFFIEETKFNGMKNNPSEYVKNFPSIITFAQSELMNKILVFSRFRIYRLAEIIQRQNETGKGLKNPSYLSWKKRLSKR